MNNNSLTPPGGEEKVLLHACCAVCVAAIIEELLESGVMPTIHFYNPNIYPHREYLIRRNEIRRFAQRLGITFIEGDYKPELHAEAVKGHENDPEGGERCGLCFEMRFRKTAEFAQKNDFKVFTSCLGISKHKDFDQVTRAGEKAASLFPGITYWGHNWRKNSGQERMAKISRREKFYRQKYCGCKLSLDRVTRRS